VRFFSLYHVSLIYLFFFFVSFLLNKYEPMKVCKLIKLILRVYVVLQFAFRCVLLI